MLATGGGQVVYPVVVVDMDGIRCRALLLLVEKGVLKGLLGKLNHGPSGKIGKDNRLVSGKSSLR